MSHRPPVLDIHIASEQEKRSAYRNVHPVWGGGQDLHVFLAKRLTSLQHNRARWWVGTIDEQVVVALGCYPLHFAVQDEIVAGIGFGAVHTHPDFRRRGYAAQLMNYVTAHESAQDAQLALLFSDIPTAYYEGMGYIAGPKTTYRCEKLHALLPVTEELQAHQRIDANVHSAWLAQTYQSCLTAQTISLSRDTAYWSYSLAKHASNDVFLQFDNIGGYARLGSTDTALVLSELLLPPHTEDETIHNIWGTLARRAQSQGHEALSTWIRPPAALLPHFEERLRTGAQPMLKALWPRHKTLVAQAAPHTLFFDVDHF